MEVSTVNELGYTELIIEEERVYEESYQMNMLRECKISGLVTVIGCGIDDRSRYIYDISGMQSLEKVYEKTPLGECEIREFCRELLALLEGLKHHMLDINHILLQPEYIYKHNDAYLFCYYPLNHREVKDSFHELSQYFVQHIDYGEVDSVILACGLHKATMEDEYDLAQLLQEHSVIEKEKEIIHEAIKNRDLNKEALWENLETTNIVDQVKVEESDEFSYGPIKANKLISMVAESSLSKIWNKKSSPTSGESLDKSVEKKKETWGDWDALLKQEGYR